MASDIEYQKGLPQLYVKNGEFDAKSFNDHKVKELLNLLTVRVDGTSGHAEWKNTDDGKISTTTNIDLEKTSTVIKSINKFNKDNDITDHSLISSDIADKKYWDKVDGRTVFDLGSYKHDLFEKISAAEVEKLITTEPKGSYLRSDEQRNVFAINLKMDVAVKTGENIDITTEAGKHRFEELRQIEEQKPQFADETKKRSFAYNLMNADEAKEKALMYKLDDDLWATSSYVKDKINLSAQARPGASKIVAVSTEAPKLNGVTDNVPETLLKEEIKKYSRNNNLNKNSPLHEILKGVAERALFEVDVKGKASVVQDDEKLDKLKIVLGEKPIAAVSIQLDDTSNTSLYHADSVISNHLNNIPGTGRNFLPAGINIKEVEGNLIISTEKELLESSRSKLARYANNTLQKGFELA